MIVYVSIGNSDDKLPQSQWSNFARAANRVLRYAVDYGHATVHGNGYSLPDSPWQNAVWCVEWDDAAPVDEYKAEFARLADVFHQDSIAWAEVSQTEFLAPPSGASPTPEALAVDSPSG